MLPQHSILQDSLAIGFGWNVWGVVSILDCNSHEFHETCDSVTLYFKKRLQTMLWHLNARVNSHRRWKQMRFRVCFYLWCELTSAMNIMKWQVSSNSCSVYWLELRMVWKGLWLTLVSAWSAFLAIPDYKCDW